MYITGLETIGLKLFGNEVSFSDLEFFLFRVAADLDDLHSVLERHGNTVQIIRRGDEKYLGEIVVQIEIVVVEGDILLGIENLEQR